MGVERERAWQGLHSDGEAKVAVSLIPAIARTILAQQAWELWWDAMMKSYKMFCAYVVIE